MDMLERLLYKQGQHSKAGAVAVLGEVHGQKVEMKISFQIWTPG